MQRKIFALTFALLALHATSEEYIGSSARPASNPKETGKRITLETKHNEITKAKIATKEQEIEDISHLGPILLMLLGAFIFAVAFFPFGGYGTIWDTAIIGLVVCGIAFVWHGSRIKEEKKLRNEIKELEASMDYADGKLPDAGIGGSSGEVFDFCPSCGAMNPDKNQFCTKCGGKLAK